MKVYMLVDMEGISGITLEAHTSAGTPEYEQARRWMTQDVNAAVQGALDGGATEIVVIDGHGANSFYNLVYQDLHDGASYIFGSPRPWYLTELDSSYDCVLMVGMHAMSGTPKAVLEHTWSGERWYKCRLNGRETGEIGLMAAFAGHFDLPVTLVTGDRAACDEAKEFIGDQVTTACVKQGLGRYSAKVLPGAVSRKLISEAARTAVQNVSTSKPVKVEGPISLEVDYIRNSHVDAIKVGAGVELVAARTIRYSGPDVAAALYLMR